MVERRCVSIAHEASGGPSGSILPSDDRRPGGGVVNAIDFGGGRQEPELLKFVLERDVLFDRPVRFFVGAPAQAGDPLRAFMIVLRGYAIGRTAYRSARRHAAEALNRVEKFLVLLLKQFSACGVKLLQKRKIGLVKTQVGFRQLGVRADHACEWGHCSGAIKSWADRLTRVGMRHRDCERGDGQTEAYGDSPVASTAS